MRENKRKREEKREREIGEREDREKSLLKPSKFLAMSLNGQLSIQVRV